MTITTQDREFLELERQFWDAIKRSDPKAASRLSDETCIVVGQQGIGEIDRATLEGMIAASSYQLQHFEFDEKDVHVRTIADGVVLVAYKVHEKLIVDGKETALDAYDTSVWVRRDGSWVCPMHTETIAGDPFGRR